MKTKNIYENIPADIPEELFEEIDSTKDIKIERIISDGHTSPPNFWYNQEKNELVFLLKGSAVIEFETSEKVNLKPGDYIKINSHQKHRVIETSKNEITVWLAIHY